MPEKVTPFTWVNSLTETKKDMIEEYGESSYPSFMVNRTLSQHSDCVFYAAEVNVYPDLDKKLQYDYYMNALRRGKRYGGKWGKVETSDDLDVVMECFKYSRARALEALKILSKKQLQDMREVVEKGTKN